MKNCTLLLLLLLLTASSKLFSQNVAVNATGNMPDTSAMLDISSVTKGFLMPRMTTVQRDAIVLPAMGLMIFNTSAVAYQVNTGSSLFPVWATLTTSASANAWSLGGNSVASVQNFGTITNFDLPFITNNTEKMRLSAGGNLGIGAAVTDGANAEKLLVDAGTGSYNVISGKGNNAGFLQLNIKNTNSGSAASSDVVATNNLGTEANGQYFIDMGINSSTYNVSAFDITGISDAYLYSTGNDFAIGNATPLKSLKFFTGGTTAANERMRIDSSGKIGIGVTSPTAFLHLKAGTTAAGTAPLKFNSGTLTTTTEAGAVEFVADKFHGTITTGAGTGVARKEFTLNDIALPSAAVPFATTNGRLTGLSTFTYATNRLSPTYITLGAGSATAGTAPLVFTSGTILSAPIAGAVEFNGTHFYGTIGSTQFQLDQQVGAAYTGSNGITLVTRDIRNNLITGVAGGQTVVGGTAASNSLTLSSTTNATKGKIIFGTSAYDEVNNRLGIGNAVPTEKLDITGNIKFSGALMPNNLAGASGSFLISGGPGAPPTWSAATSGTNSGDVTIGTPANGLSLAAQVLSLGLASTSTTGALSLTDWGTFNAKVGSISLGGTLVDAATTFSVSGGAATGTRTLNTQAPNRIFAGPASGVAATPTFRLLAPADLPIATTTATTGLGAVSVGNGLSITGAGVLSADTQSATGAAGGDLTGTYPNPVLVATGVAANTYGNNAGTSYPYITVDAKGRIITAATKAIAFPVTTVNAQTGTVSLGLGNLNDVTITTPLNNQLLQYNGTRWVNTTQAYLSSAILSLNGLTDAIQTFAVPGTTGTAPAWTSASAIHTLNIPLAANTGVTAGLLSNADWTTFNNKADTARSWSVTGNNGTNSGVNFLGTLDNTSLRFRSKNLQGILLDSNGNVGVGLAPLFATGAPEKFLVDAGTTGSYNVISGKGSINNYLQLNIQNRSAGGNASSDVVATADNGDEFSNYVDMGINSSNNTSGYGGANDAYLYNLGQNFLIGAGTAGKSLVFLTGGGVLSSNERMRIDGSGNIGIGNAAPTEKLDVTGNVRFSGALMPNNLPGAAGTFLTSNGAATPPTWTAITAAGLGAITSLNGLTTTSQTFAIPGTTGTAPAWSSAGSVHTLNIPLANAGASVTAGLLSNTDWNTFNDKANTANVWSVTGNAGTSPSSNFLGTTDAQDLVLKTNSVERFRIVNAVSGVTGTAGNVIVGDANSGTLKSNKEFVIREDGDIYGPSILRLRNRNGENGAIFETIGASAALVDFLFKTGTVSTPLVSNIRFETRAVGAGMFITGNSMEWQIGQAANPTMIISAAGSGNSVLKIGNFGIGNVNPGEKLDVTGNVRFSGALIAGTDAGTTGNFLKSNGSGSTPTWTAITAAGLGAITSLNGLTTTSQLFANGTTSTAPIFTSVGSTHTLHIPLASAGGTVTAGLISNADYTAFNTKQAQLNGTGFVKASGTTISYDNSTYLTANQTITFTPNVSGDVTGGTTGTTTLFPVLSIGANKVTLGQMAQVATGTFLGRTTAGTGNVEAMTTAEAKALLGSGGTNTGDVTLAGGSQTYLTLAGQVLTANPVNLSGTHVTGILAATSFPALTGEVTNTAGSLGTTVANSAVIGKVLTGYSSSSGIILATDNILQAIQKLNGNDATNANLTGMVTSVGNATTVVTNANLTGPVTSAGNATSITDNAVTYNKIQAVSTTGKLLGSSSTTTPVQEITIGSGLNLTATTLTATTQTATGSAGGDLTGTYPNPTIAAGAVSNGKLAQMAALSLKGNNTGATATPLDLSVSQVNTMLGSLTGGSIAWPGGSIYSTPTTGVVSANNITFSPALASQSAYTLFGKGASAGTPSFLASIDSNWIPSLHTELYYNTKYQLTGATNKWGTTGNAGTSAVLNNFIGTTDNNGFRIKANNIQGLMVDSLGNVAIGAAPVFTTLLPREKFLVDAGVTTSINAIAARGTINNYLQFNIQNLSNGTGATSDIVATADNGNESGNYVDLGINGSGYTGSAIQTGVANDGYLISAGNDFYMVNSSADKSMLFLTGGTGIANERMRILANGRVGMGVQNPTAPFVVKDTMEIRRIGALSQLLFTNTGGTGDFRIGGDGGDLFWQGGGGRSLQMGSFWPTIIQGDRQTSAYPAFTTVVSGTGVLIPASRDASVPLAITQYSGTQSSNLTEWRTASGVALSAVDKDGNLGLGLSNPSARLHVVGTNPLTLIGVQTGSATDSLLTIIGGVVKKVAPSTLAVANAWALTGNATTNPSSNFLGTTDAQPVLFKVNNQQIGRLEQTSFSFGPGAGTNTATNSFALGYGAILGSGVSNAMSMGTSANASISNTFAIGNNAISNPNNGDNSFAIGNAATVASTASFAIGPSASTSVSISNAFAIGKSAIVNGSNSMAIGNNATIGSGAAGAIAMGNGAQANGNGSVSIGTATVATGSTNSIAIGTSAAVGASLTNSTAIGYNASTTFSNTMILGDRSNQLLSVGIGSEAFSSSTREKLLVDAGTVVSNGYISVIGGKGSTNNYMQMNLQNGSNGSAASSDFVATNDAGTELNQTGFIDMGINSSGNTTTGVLGGNSTAYLYSTGNDFVIGNNTPLKPLRFYTTVAGPVSNEAMRIESSGKIGIGTTAPATALHVVGANPLTLFGVVALSTIATTDSLLTITSGLVKKLPASYYWSTAGNTFTSIQKLGTVSNHDLPFITNNTEKMRISTGGYVGIGASTFNGTNPEQLLVNAGATGTNAFQNVIVGKGNTNSYAQLNIQNASNGNGASSDVVATADNGDESINFIDMGINSSLNSSGIMGVRNDAYLYNVGQNLFIGTATPTKSLIFMGGGTDSATNEKMRINDGGVKIGAAGSVLTGILKVNVTDATNPTVTTATSIITLTVTGASVNGSVIVNPRTLPSGIVIAYSRVSAANTVLVGLISVGSIPLGTVTFDVTVIQ